MITQHLETQIFKNTSGIRFIIVQFYFICPGFPAYRIFCPQSFKFRRILS